MENNIDLSNNYQIKLISENNLPKEAINIEEINMQKIKKNNVLMIMIDFRNIKQEDYKKTLKHFMKIKKRMKKIQIGKNENGKKTIGYIINYDKNNIKHQEFIQAINAILFDTKYDRYEYIYDTVCDYLDGYFYGKNLCDFKDNKCGEKRNTKSTIGCCRHPRIMKLGPLTRLVQCEYLNKENYTCDAKCISCKLFTCDYLEKKGIKFKIKDILLLDTFFNPIQKYYIKYMVFTPKEKIIKRILKF